jgi:hypothetical protein
MITIHVDILDRFNRAMPIVGIPFFIYQSAKHLKMAREEDEAYVTVMRNMGAEPDERLLTHSVQQEWFLITSVALTLILAWLISILALKGLIEIKLLFLVTTILAMLVDLISGKVALKIFTSKEARNAERSA